MVNAPHMTTSVKTCGDEVCCNQLVICLQIVFEDRVQTTKYAFPADLR